MLPHGNQKGWLGELEWIIDLIMFFDPLQKELEKFLIEKSRKEKYK